MELLVIIGLISLGIALIVIEIVFVPGTTIVGVGGFLFGAYGIYLSFESYGQEAGVITLIASVSIGLGIVIYTLKSRAWERFSLKENSESKVNDELVHQYSLGEIGTTLSSLKPYGKAIFNENIIEVKSNEGFIAEKSEIQIVKIDSDKIIVKSK